MALVRFNDGNDSSVEHVVKKEWGVITIDGGEKRSYPWHRVDYVYEKVEE